MSADRPGLPDDVLADAQILWDYHQLHHELRPTDVGIGLGSHDPGVADHTADLYHRGMFPLVVFTGANAPTTVGLFPDGEAVHYARRATELGVPADAILIEPRATNTAENLTFARQLLDEQGITPQSVTLITRPYQQRRAYATCRKQWPDVDVICSSRLQSFRDYLHAIADDDRVINMLVGDTQRIRLYAERGFSISQPVPRQVQDAYNRLVHRGYSSRLSR
ncbi:YdcF family protein [Jiangella endophytica]|uniref:YdcF family protein n=1 Tax=Jiangella endophytica TaxID=1623398 RepID=UPI000E34BCED|nr:YdcF family protein [Jiangella endophytica]